MFISPESCSVTTQEALHTNSPMEQRKPASVPTTQTEAKKRSDVDSLIVILLMSRKEQGFLVYKSLYFPSLLKLSCNGSLAWLLYNLPLSSSANAQYTPVLHKQWCWTESIWIWKSRLCIQPTECESSVAERRDSKESPDGNTHILSFIQIIPVFNAWFHLKRTCHSSNDD